MSGGVRVLSIFVRTGTSTYPDAEAHLAALFARQLPAVTRDVVVVDNLLPPGVAESAPGRTVIGGDNRAREFSAIDAALAHVGEAIWRYDLVNLVTEAFEQLYTAYLERVTSDVLRAILGQRVCLGHIDCYNEEVEVLGIRTQHWARTSFVLLPPAELRLLGSVVSAEQRRPWFSGRPDAPFAPTAPLSERYQRYILDWLLGADIGQGVRWHRSLTLDAAGLDGFEHKARAVLNEMLFGVRLRAAGCRVIDVTWLSGRQASGVPVDWDTPWWEQLAGRDRDALRIEAPQCGWHDDSAAVSGAASRPVPAAGGARPGE